MWLAMIMISVFFLFSKYFSNSFQLLIMFYVDFRWDMEKDSQGS